MPSRLVPRCYHLLLHDPRLRSPNRRNPSALLRIMERMPTDFRDGKTFPRRGREAVGEALWLLRASDKGRASAAGTLYDYIYPCPMDRGMMERWGMSAGEFDAALRQYTTDEQLFAWFTQRVRPEDVRAANEWLSSERSENLDRQDAEEVAAVEHR